MSCNRNDTAIRTPALVRNVALVGALDEFRVDGDTLTDDTVTLRERDSCEQIRLPANNVATYIQDRVNG